MKRIHFEKIDSTHLYAKRNIENFNEITIISASFQTSGIGRKNDPWIAKENSSLLVSIVYDAPKKDKIPYLSQIWALALKEALFSLHLPITFKHPNDLMIHGKKLSGILSEIIDRKAITSIGLNIEQTEEDLSKIDQPATSLFIETRKKLDHEKILKALLSNIKDKITL
ncbi:biotin--[acetyl-CoA-carboxylase] ligase [bacterium]|nr:biotin--[acetyl-CoA-carboxylase] ligase [bacterium]